MKKSILLTALLLTGFAASAQTPVETTLAATKQSATPPLEGIRDLGNGMYEYTCRMKPEQTQTPQRRANDDEIEWSPTNATMKRAWDGWNGSNHRYHVAMRLTDASLQGMQVVAVRSWNYFNDTQLSDCSVWVSNNLEPGKEQQEKSAELKDGQFEARFDTPVEITDEDPVYVGFNGYQSTDDYGLVDTELAGGPESYVIYRLKDGDTEWKFLDMSSICQPFITVILKKSSSQSQSSQSEWCPVDSTMKRSYDGFGGTYNYHVAMRLTEPSLQGKKVVGVRSWNYFSDTQLTNCSVWVSNNLKPGMEQQQKSATMKDGQFEGIFDSAVEITDEDPVYVGFNGYQESGLGLVDTQVAGNPESYVIYYQKDGETEWKFLDMSSVCQPFITVLLSDDGSTPQQQEPKFEFSHVGSGNAIIYEGKMAKYRVGAKFDCAPFEGMSLMGVKAYNFNTYGQPKDMGIWASNTWTCDEPNIAKKTAGRSQGVIEAPFKAHLISQGEIIYAGYDIETTDNNSAIPYTADVTGLDGGYLRYTYKDGSWTSEDLSAKGTAFISIILKGNPKGPQNSLEPKALKRQALGVEGKPVYVQIPVTNASFIAANNVSYTYTLNGATIEDAVTGEGLVSGLADGYINLTFAPVAKAGTYPCTLTITKVNNADNEAAIKQVTFDVTVFSASSLDQPDGTTPAIHHTGDQTYYRGNGWRENSAAALFKDGALKGLKLKAIKISNLIDDPAVRNVTIWTSSALKYQPDGLKLNAVSNGTEAYAELPEPIELSGSSMFYVGYTFDVLNTAKIANPVPYTAPAGGLQTFWLYDVTNTKWVDCSNLGSAPITLYLEGSIPQNCLKVNRRYGNMTFATNGPVTVNLQLVNNGTEPVENAGYTYTIGDLTGTGVATFDPAIPAGMLAKRELQFNMAGLPLEGDVTGTVTIDKVNSATNEATANSFNVDMKFVPYIPVHRPIEEEGTGTTCGWCPRGMLGLHEMAKRYPDFIAAAYHHYDPNDPMYVSDPLPFPNSGGYPCGSMDRLEEIDPFNGSSGMSLGVEQDYLSAREMVAPGSVDLDTKWNDNKDQITVTATSKFSFVESDNDYKLGYIVIVDSLKGSTSAWNQNNVYSVRTESDPLLKTLTNGEFDLTTYNHVVINASNAKGTYSIPATTTAGETVTHTATLPVTNENFDINPDNVKVIGLLIDNKGFIRNARVVKAGESTTPDPEVTYDTPSVINTIDAVDGHVIYYDLMGRLVATPSTGIYIKVQNGKATKILL